MPLTGAAGCGMGHRAARSTVPPSVDGRAIANGGWVANGTATVTRYSKGLGLIESLSVHGRVTANDPAVSAWIAGAWVRIVSPAVSVSGAVGAMETVPA